MLVILGLVFPFLRAHERYRLRHTCRQVRLLVEHPEWEKRAMLEYLKYSATKSVLYTLNTPINLSKVNRVKQLETPDGFDLDEAGIQKLDRLRRLLLSWHMMCARVAACGGSVFSVTVTEGDPMQEEHARQSSMELEPLFAVCYVASQLWNEYLRHLAVQHWAWSRQVLAFLSQCDPTEFSQLAPLDLELWWRFGGPVDITEVDDTGFHHFFSYDYFCSKKPPRLRHEASHRLKEAQNKWMKDLVMDALNEEIKLKGFKPYVGPTSEMVLWGAWLPKAWRRKSHLYSCRIILYGRNECSIDFVWRKGTRLIEPPR